MEGLELMMMEGIRKMMMIKVMVIMMVINLKATMMNPTRTMKLVMKKIGDLKKDKAAEVVYSERSALRTQYMHAQ